jgi:excisionase family DNA binding protein
VEQNLLSRESRRTETDKPSPKESLMSTTDPLPHLLTIDELADHLGVSVRHVRRLIAERRVPHLRVGRFIRFDPADVTAWLNDTRVANSRTI